MEMLRNRSSRLSVSAGLLLACALACPPLAANPYPIKTCDDLYKAVDRPDGLMAIAGQYKPDQAGMDQLILMAKSCLATKSKVAEALRVFGDYENTAMHRDLPNSMAQDPKLSEKQLQHQLNSAYNQDEADLAGIRKHLMKMDHQALETVMRFMVTQQGDDLYGIYALEVIARCYPEEYDSYKTLMVPGTNLSDHWESVKESYLNKRDPIKVTDDP
jgi:hypothetical protein